MNNFHTADICDNDKNDDIRVLDPIFNSYGKRKKCFGKVSTILLDEDNSGLIELLKEPGKGRVVVVKVLGEICAVVGDKLMSIAKENGWEGIVVDGYVRDVSTTKNIDVVLLAKGVYPKKSRKKSNSHKNITLQIGRIAIYDEDIIYIDEDGVVLKREN